jgi:RHS repeat-associated protein
VLRHAYDEQNAWADLNSGNSVIARYVYGDDTDELWARAIPSGQTNSGIAWYLTDQQGSVRDLMDNTGIVQDHLDYSGFGGVVTETNTSCGDRYKWTGREFDYDTGLQYNRARYYDPSTGRWLSEDPHGFAGLDLNLFRYVGNNSTNQIDPLGLMSRRRALAILKKQIADWHAMHWNYTANLLQHFIDKKGPAPYAPTVSDAMEMSCYSRGVFHCLMISRIFSNTKPPKFNIANEKVDVIATMSIEAELYRNHGEMPEGTVPINYMLYTFGGFVWSAKAQAEDPEALDRDKYYKAGVLADIEVSDGYSFPPGALNYRNTLFEAYRAASTLEFEYNYPGFLHSISFKSQLVDVPIRII